MVLLKPYFLIEELTFCPNQQRKCARFFRFKVNTSSYHPQTDGLVERFNSTLCQSLSIHVAHNQKDWDEFVPLILFAHRTSVCEAIGDTPFYCLYGRECRLPLDVKLLSPADENLTTSALEYRKRIIENVELAQNLARENLQRAQQNMKDYYDRNAKDPQFEVGQKVWVYTPRTKKGLSKKLLHNWLGPYRIVEKSSPVHFRLRTDTNKKVTFAVHANRMKPFLDPSLRPIDPPLFVDPDHPDLDESDIPENIFVQESQDEGGPSNLSKDVLPNTPFLESDAESQPNVIDNETVFAAEKILKHRIDDGKNQYLVKWAGYPKNQATWEPEENILDRRLIDVFNQS